MNYVINEPIWKTKSVGLLERTLENKNTVHITYTSKNGSRPYPFVYTIDGEYARTCPVQVVKGNRLRLVRISDMGTDGISNVSSTPTPTFEKADVSVHTNPVDDFQETSVAGQMDLELKN